MYLFFSLPFEGLFFILKNDTFSREYLKTPTHSSYTLFLSRYGISKKKKETKYRLEQTGFYLCSFACLLDSRQNKDTRLEAEAKGCEGKFMI